MVEMALVFVGFALLILVLLLLASIYYVPRALAEEDHGTEDSDRPSGGATH